MPSWFTYNSEEKVKNRGLMTRLGCLCVLFSVVEFGIGASAYNFLQNFHIGGWWAGILGVVCGWLGLYSSTKGMAMAGMAISLIAIIVAVAATIIDGSYAYELLSIKACSIGGLIKPLELVGNSVSGESAYYKDATYCERYFFQNTNICSCTNKNGDCFGYDLSASNAGNCNIIMTNYAITVRASAIFCGFLSFFLMLYFVVSSIGVCCGAELQLHADDITEGGASSRSQSGSVVLESTSAPSFGHKASAVSRLSTQDTKNRAEGGTDNNL